MKWVLALALLLVPSLASAQLSWTDMGSGSCSIASNQTCRVTWDENSAVNSTGLFVAGLTLTATLFPDTNDGDGTVAKATLRTCPTSALTNCRDVLLFDTNGDGVPDSGQFDATTTPVRLGHREIRLTGWIYLQRDANPGSGDTAEFHLVAIR